jgi:hypothetical protein
MATIKVIKARQIYDSRGNPTVEVSCQEMELVLHHFNRGHIGPLKTVKCYDRRQQISWSVALSQTFIVFLLCRIEDVFIEPIGLHC